jgi:hypothetical protein
MSISFDVVNENAAPGRYIARTMHLLASSTPERPNEVRVLVYGQSISKQAWWLEVKGYLRERYPHADLVMENRAIGGFHSPRLVRCAAHDVRLFYPDLIIFHDYGPRDVYETIVRAMRRETTAEIMIQTDHVGATQDDAWHNEHSYEWLPALCDELGLELVAVRKNWKRYLAEQDLEPAALLRDNVHLNDDGNALMAAIINAHFVLVEAAGEDPQGLVEVLRAGESFDATGDAVEVDFTGNRVDLVPEQALNVEVLLDGAPPSRAAAGYVAERPWLDRSWPPKVGLPVRIDLGDPASGAPEREADEWTIKVTDVVDNGREIGFELFSGRHGFDGGGRSDADFVSDSGRIVLERSAWFVRETPEFFHMLPAVEVGEEITFAVCFMGRDAAQTAPGSSLPVTVVQLAGAAGGEHRLKLSRRGDGGLGLDELHVHRPPLSPPGPQ